MRKKSLFFALLFFGIVINTNAQVGQHRNDFSIGVNGGYVMSNVGFTPKVTQGMHGGMTGGFSMRYICEKYFNTICSIYAEVNYAQLGWKEDIVDIQNAPVANGETGLPEKYSRTLNYVQIPVLAHLAWGRENKGFQFFFQAGPQIGFMLSESTETNFDLSKPNLADRSNKEATQYQMPVEHKIDYGITAGLGVEYSIPKVGHFLLDGRYYYGLGNLYGDSKRDYFAKSNLSNIVVKLTYLFDITKTK
ncbi:MAG TPA: porin family protein [Prevotella sp.]